MTAGLLLIDKGEGVTSRYVDNRIHRLFHTHKVGHLGTLDPFATGLLIVAVNEATKYLPFLPDEDKTYVASLRLGIKTSTGDKTGEEIETAAVPSLSKEKVIETLNAFLGESEQLPPMTSAIKVDGTALYKLAHKGEEIERKKRKIFVHEIGLLSMEGDTITFYAKVSKGTYMRVLGEDVAVRLGTVGYLESLRRTKVGDITLEKAIRLEDVKEDDLVNPASFVALPRIEIEKKDIDKVRNGVRLSFSSISTHILLTHKGKGLAVYEKTEEGPYRCLRGLL